MNPFNKVVAQRHDQLPPAARCVSQLYEHLCIQTGYVPQSPKTGNLKFGIQGPMVHNIKTGMSLTTSCISVQQARKTSVVFHKIQRGVTGLVDTLAGEAASQTAQIKKHLMIAGLAWTILVEEQSTCSYTPLRKPICRCPHRSQW